MAVYVVYGQREGKKYEFMSSHTSKREAIQEAKDIANHYPTKVVKESALERSVKQGYVSVGRGKYFK